jgi:hypothetical protein
MEVSTGNGKGFNWKWWFLQEMEKVFPGTAMFMKLCIIVEKVSTNSIIGPSLLLRRKAQTSKVTKYQGRALFSNFPIYLFVRHKRLIYKSRL